VLAVLLAYLRDRSEQPGPTAVVLETPSARTEEGAVEDALAVEPKPTPRPVTVTARWIAPEGTAAERYSDHPFEKLELAYGERLHIERVCVSDARKVTSISYTNVSGHTGLTLLLGDRDLGRVDPANRNCTLFDGLEVARLERCKCWFQCAGEQHFCTVSARVARP
jgi:hypothetical protein